MHLRFLPAVLYGNLKVLAAFGIVSIGFGEIFTILGLANLKAQTGSLLALIEPVSGVFFDTAVLGIGLSSETLAGCASLWASAVIISLNDSEKLPEKGAKNSPEISKEISQPFPPQVSPGKFTVSSTSSLARKSAFIFPSGVWGASPQPGARISIPSSRHARASIITSSGPFVSRVSEGDTFPTRRTRLPAIPFAKLTPTFFLNTDPFKPGICHSGSRTAVASPHIWRISSQERPCKISCRVEKQTFRTSEEQQYSARPLSL